MPEPEILKQISIAPNKTVILYNWMEVPEGRNLVLIDAGELRWRAVPPMKDEHHDDCFTNVMWDGEKLTAFTWSCFEVAVDLATGNVTILKFWK